MPSELPYLPSYKNVGKLFEKIRTAKRPESFTTRFLANTIGLKSAGDRPLISLLKTLEFLDSSGRPTPTYDALKNEKIAASAIADGIRIAYAPLFEANEKAHTLEHGELKGLVAQVAGTDSNATSKIVGTLKALLNVADFSVATTNADEADSQAADSAGDDETETVNFNSMKFKGMNSEFHYNIQVHLPSNGSEETYMNIFNALRKVFK